MRACAKTNCTHCACVAAEQNSHCLQVKRAEWSDSLERVDGLERPEEMLVVVSVSVYPEHGGRDGEGEGRTLVPEADSVLLDEERPQRVADLVRIVGVRYVETHQHEFFHVDDGGDSEVLEGAGE